MPRRNRRSIAVLAAGVLLTPPAEAETDVSVADPSVEQAKLTADDGETGEEFGFSVALSGDTALVGVRFADVDGNTGQGAAYVFTRSGGAWSQQAKLTADDGEAGDRFGFAVALSGDTALVGADFANVDGNAEQGAAYIFTRNGAAWSQQAKLTADDGTVFAFFGSSVALSGDSAVVGAPQADDFLADVGAAYVFTRSGAAWSQQIKLTADDGLPGDDFGVSVAFAADTALVGAHNATVDGNSDRGAAYVFTRIGGVWGQQAKLTASDGAMDDEFGVSVALAADTVLVGAHFANANGNADRGAAYVFTRSGAEWGQQAKLTAHDGGSGDELGVSVALAADTALVGAHFADVNGAAYVFTRGGATWSQQAKLTPSDGTVAGSFGSSVAVSGDTALVGSPFAVVNGNTEQGAAYVYVPPFVPVSLAVDLMPFDSDGNDVFEPGELVDLAPAWRNNDVTARILAGSAANFTGPPGPAYTLWRDEADYGLLESQETASCSAFLGECYAVGIGSGPRPTQHWDATVDETLTDGTSRTWTLHIGDSFGDVARTHPFYDAIEALLHHGVTAGCAGGNFCPSSDVTRTAMAVFVLRAREGRDYEPPICVAGAESFSDVPAANPSCPWIEELFNRGVVVGCGGGDYCPTSPVTRAQMAVFLLKTLEGASYTPPSCTGLFDDVACPSPFADWIEDLFGRGITAGCDTSPLRFCPGNSITRGQSAVFQSKTFDLALYGP